MKNTLQAFIHAQLIKPRDAAKLLHDVHDMRQRIEKAHPTANPWDIKYVRGGLMDMDFIAQYLILRHAPHTPGAKPGSASEIFDWLKRSGRIDPALADELIASDHFLGQLFNMLRLCCDHQFDEISTPPGLKKLLVEAVKEKDFPALKKRLIAIEETVRGHYIQMLSGS